MLYSYTHMATVGVKGLTARFNASCRRVAIRSCRCNASNVRQLRQMSDTYSYRSPATTHQKNIDVTSLSVWSERLLVKCIIPTKILRYSLKQFEQADARPDGCCDSCGSTGLSVQIIYSRSFTFMFTST